MNKGLMQYSLPQNTGFFIGCELEGTVKISNVVYTNAKVGVFAGWKLPSQHGKFTKYNLRDFWDDSVLKFGNGTSHLSKVLTTCPIAPLGGLAMPNSMEVNYALGSQVIFTCPAGYVFDSGINWRKYKVTCVTGGTWDPLPLPTCVLNTLGFCDPSCLNGGTCDCSGSSCVCTCPAGYSGPDCSFLSKLILYLSPMSPKTIYYLFKLVTLASMQFGHSVKII